MIYTKPACLAVSCSQILRLMIIEKLFIRHIGYMCVQTK